MAIVNGNSGNCSTGIISQVYVSFDDVNPSQTYAKTYKMLMQGSQNHWLIVTPNPTSDALKSPSEARASEEYHVYHFIQWVNRNRPNKFKAIRRYKSQTNGNWNTVWSWLR